MDGHGFKADLQRYLQESREAALWKLDGVSEYDARRPLVPTGTNLLGLVKHLAFVEFAYFGDTFGRLSPDQIPYDETDPNTDMFAGTGESREFITSLYRKAWDWSDETIYTLPLDAVGRVPHWPAERARVTLHHVLVRMAGETARHAGHMDILRELIDGAAGYSAGKSSLAFDDQSESQGFYERVERAAREAPRRD